MASGRGRTGGALRRRVPWWVLALVFVVLPIVEIYFLIQVGQVIGVWWTILLLIADGLLGSWLMKREGARAWAALRLALDEGRMPARELADGGLILIGGTLLMAPGFVTDVAGLFLVLPLTRPLARSVLTRYLSRRLLSSSAAASGARDAGPFSTRTQTRQRPGTDEVVRGEVVDDSR